MPSGGQGPSIIFSKLVSDLAAKTRGTINSRTVGPENISRIETEIAEYGLAFRMLADRYGPSLDDDGMRWLEVIETNALKMGQLIDDLLALSRAGRTAMKKTGIDMNKLVGEVLESLKVGDEEHLGVAVLRPNGARHRHWHRLGNHPSGSGSRDEAVR